MEPSLRPCASAPHALIQPSPPPSGQTLSCPIPSRPPPPPVSLQARPCSPQWFGAGLAPHCPSSAMVGPTPSLPLQLAKPCSLCHGGPHHIPPWHSRHDPISTPASCHRCLQRAGGQGEACPAIPSIPFGQHPVLSPPPGNKDRGQGCEASSLAPPPQSPLSPPSWRHFAASCPEHSWSTSIGC